MENLRKTINNYIENNETILSMTASNPRDRDKIQRLKIRPVRKKEKLIYQAESFVGTKVFHKSIEANTLADFVADAMENDFKQLEAKTDRHSLTVLVSKKGKLTIKEKYLQHPVKTPRKQTKPLLHTTRKNSIFCHRIHPSRFWWSLGYRLPKGKS